MEFRSRVLHLSTWRSNQKHEKHDPPMTDEAPVQRRGQVLRRNLGLLTADGAVWAVMTGTAEWQFALFALALGL